MTIHALYDDLQTDGVNLALFEGQIKASGLPGTINATVAKRIRSNKPALIALLTDELLERAAIAVPGVTADDLRANLDVEDWQDPDLITYERLKGLAGCIRSHRSVLAGQVPPGWTDTTNCRNCGPVPIFPGGSGESLGCPWCFAGASAPSVK